MTSKRLGSKIAFISAAALLVAACSKDGGNLPTETASAPAPVEETTNSNSDITNPVTTPTVTADPLNDSSFNGFENYSGGDRVFFAYDSSEISSDARNVLGKQATWLMRHTNVRVTIEGHCDERGTREYNLALGERRATSVKNYLIALGVPSSRLSTISYGKERPASVGDYAQNRRGVVVFN